MFDEVSISKRYYIHNSINYFFVKDKSFDLLLNNLKEIMKSISISSQQSKQVNKNGLINFQLEEQSPGLIKIINAMSSTNGRKIDGSI